MLNFICMHIFEILVKKIHEEKLCFKKHALLIMCQNEECIITVVIILNKKSIIFVLILIEK